MTAYRISPVVSEKPFNVRGELMNSYIDADGSESVVFKTIISDREFYDWLSCWHTLGSSILLSREGGVYTIQQEVHKNKVTLLATVQ